MTAEPRPRVEVEGTPRVAITHPRNDDRYELSQLAGGEAVLQYLRGSEVGDTRLLPSVHTFPSPNAFLATQAIDEKAGGVLHPVEGGGIAAYETTAPHTVYVALPSDERRQIVVTDGSGGEAQRVAFSGAIQPVRCVNRQTCARGRLTGVAIT